MHFPSCYLVWNFLQAVQSPDMIQRIYGRREATVETEYLFRKKKNNLFSAHCCGKTDLGKQPILTLLPFFYNYSSLTLAAEKPNLIPTEGNKTKRLHLAYRESKDTTPSILSISCLTATTQLASNVPREDPQSLSSHLKRTTQAVPRHSFSSRIKSLLAPSTCINTSLNSSPNSQ